MATVADKLLTIDEFAAMPDPGYPTELVRGRIVAMPPPQWAHGKCCFFIGIVLGSFVRSNSLGHCLTNDSGVVTERNPDTLRGADFAFYSYRRVPMDQEVKGYPEVAPDLVFEVVSPTDRRGDILRKVAEYLDAGVTLVVVADPRRNKVENHRADALVAVLDADDEWSAPDILPGFSIKVRSFFEE